MWEWLDAFLGNNKKPQVARSDDALEGMRLDYLIGRDAVSIGTDGRITEVGYDIDTVPSRGIGVAYCNLFSEKGRISKYGPYLNNSDTAEEYGEGQIDPKGAGWLKNLNDQFARRTASGFHYIELDNPDAYSVADVVGVIEMAARYNLKVIAKNPAIMDGDPVPYVGHANVYGVIVEKGAGTPRTMENLRRRAGRPDLPVWFVYFGNGKAQAQQSANQIKAGGYDNMYVTYSAVGEYGSSQDVN
jgi:hypothetical protein